MTGKEHLPWIQIDLRVQDLREDNPKEQRIYLYEEDYKTFKAFLSSLKCNCTASEMHQIFDYLWEKKADKSLEFEPTEEERKKIAEHLAKSEWLKKAMNDLIKEIK